MILPIVSRGFDSNIYLIKGEVNTIVDTGTGLNVDRTLKILKREIDLEEINQIVLTHEHIDHVGGAGKIVESLRDVETLSHRRTKEVLDGGEEATSKMFSIPLPDVDIDIPLDDGDRIKMGDDEYLVIYTPGHSEGSMCLYSNENRVLFSGDTIFSHGGIGRFDLPGGNLYEMKASIERLSELEVSDLYPGHGDYIIGFGHHHIMLSLRNVMRI